MPPRGRHYLRWGKRLLDLVLVVLTLPFTVPVMILLAFSVRFVLGRPVLFRQFRPGRGGVPFEIVKFRTMTEHRDDLGHLKPDDERLTRFGRGLRSTSLDELPELVNVLRGEMSVVGPRPLLMEYLPRYTSEQARRHEVRPGITGWAQVKGRNALSWKEKFDLDIWYVDHVGLWLDVKILVLTVLQVFSGRGVHAAGHPTMPEFTGGDRE